jgi:hypothetical protein
MTSWPKLTKVLVVLVGVTVLQGCVQVQNTWDLLTSARVSPTLVIVTGNSFDALEATATTYLRLPRCTGQNGPACRSPKATAQIIPAIRAGRVARNNLEAFLRTHPGQLATQGLYDALTSAVQTLQGILIQYNVGAVQ